MKLLLFKLSIALKAFFFPCAKDVKNSGFEKNRSDWRIEKIAKLEEHINESSGLVHSDHIPGFITINDSGGESVLYYVDGKTWKSDRQHVSARNKDWETISINDYDVFIGDIGNNSNSRKDLAIYIFDMQEQQLKGEILFRYPDQKAFPPRKENKNFDCEAMVFSNGSLYLVSKNWGERTAKLYRIPASPGNYVAELVDTIFMKGQITGAALDAENNELMLLSYGNLYTFDVAERISFRKPKKCAYFGRLAQSEAIEVKDDIVYITNEQRSVFTLKRKD